MLYLGENCFTSCVGFFCTAVQITPKYTHIPSFLSHPPLPSPTPPGHHRAPVWVPCVEQQLPTSCLTHGSICVSMLIPPFVPGPPFPAVFTSLFSMCVSPFLPWREVHLDHFSRFHIYVLIHNICFSLSDLLYSVWQTLGDSIFLFLNSLKVDARH